MLEKAGASTGEVDLEADVSVNTVTLGVVLDFVEPDITSLDPFKDLGLEFISKFIPPFAGNINALLDPGKFCTTCVDELL